MSTHGVSRQNGILLLLGVTLFWGLNWPAMKISVEQFPVWSYRAICLAVGGSGLLLIARAAGLSLAIPRREFLPLALTAFFNVTLWHIMSATALTEISASRGSIVAFTMPLWATLLAIPLLGERLTPARAVGLAIGLAGLSVLILPDWRNIVAHPMGILAMLAAAIGWAVGTVFIKYFRWTMPATVLVGWQLLLGGSPALLGMVFIDRGFDPAAVSLAGWFALAYSSIMPLIFCQWAWVKIIGTFPAQVASISILMMPVVGVGSSNLLLGEPLGPDLLLALLLEFVAIAIVLFRPSRVEEAVARDPG